VIIRSHFETQIVTRQLGKRYHFSGGAEDFGDHREYRIGRVGGGPAVPRWRDVDGRAYCRGLQWRTPIARVPFPGEPIFEDFNLGSVELRQKYVGSAAETKLMDSEFIWFVRESLQVLCHSVVVNPA
jgi:hypothetical protein